MVNSQKNQQNEFLFSWERVKKFLQYFTYLIAASYFCGFFVVNFYFSQYGFVNPVILSARYLPSGVLFLITCGFLISLASMLLKTVFRGKSPLIALWFFFYLFIVLGSHVLEIAILKAKYASSLFGKIFSASLLLLVPFVILPIIEKKCSKKWNYILQVAMSALLIAYLLIVGTMEFWKLVIFVLGITGTWYYFQPSKKEVDHLSIKSPVLAYDLVLGFGMFLLYQNSFATSIYPNISQKFGGGKPFQVELYANEVKKDILIHMGLEFTSNCYKGLLLHETSDAVFVVVKKDSSKFLIQIQKRELAGIKYIFDTKNKESK